MKNPVMDAVQSEDGLWTASFKLVPGRIGGELTIALRKQCACSRPIALVELRDGLKNLGRDELFSKSHLGLRGLAWENFLQCLNESMESYGIVECIDKAHFLAQVAAESDSLRTTAEYRNRDGSNPSRWSRYSGGARYHGRGLIQLTHDHNYRKYSEYVGVDYVSEPDMVGSQIEVAVDSACWYWRKGSAWGDLSSRARSNDFIMVTVGVNGGFNHYAQRKLHLQSLAEVFSVHSCGVHAGANFDIYNFVDSALSRTRNGPIVWRRDLGECDAL